jgi:hypothetical protein
LEAIKQSPFGLARWQGEEIGILISPLLLDHQLFPAAFSLRAALQLGKSVRLSLILYFQHDQWFGLPDRIDFPF